MTVAVVFYDDGTSIKKKEGLLVEQNEHFVKIIEDYNGEKTTITIPMIRVLRVEVQGDGNE